VTAKFHTVIRWPKKSAKKVLALGPESDGNFSFFDGHKIYFSPLYGDLLKHKNFTHFRENVLDFLKDSSFRPEIVLTDLHPDYVTSVWGLELTEELKIELNSVQHHLAHIFSVIGEKVIDGKELPSNFSGIASDGTGYGSDGKIWGGEVFNFSHYGRKRERVGRLEEQILIGGDLAVKEPARMVISVLSKFLKKEEVFEFVRDYYSRNVFELLYNQMKEGFNCQEASSTGRVLDAVSILLGFCGNQREYKHQPMKLLDENSTDPYNLEPIFSEEKGLRVLLTTPLFEYLIGNIAKDKGRLAATAQTYLAEGLYQMAKVREPEEVYLAGGVANNKVFSQYLSQKGVTVSNKIPRGDAGLSFGQLVNYLLANSGD